MTLIRQYLSTYRKLFHKELFKNELMKNKTEHFFYFYLQNIIVLFFIYIGFAVSITLKMGTKEHLWNLGNHILQSYLGGIVFLTTIMLFFVAIFYIQFQFLYITHKIFHLLNKSKNFKEYNKQFIVISFYASIIIMNVCFVFILNFSSVSKINGN